MNRMLHTLLCCGLLMLATTASAQLYHWIDENGVKHFSNEKPPEGVTIIETVEEAPASDAVDRPRNTTNEESLDAVLQRQQELRRQDEAARQKELEQEAAEKARLEAEKARLEAEKEAKRKKRYEKGTGEQKRRRRERAAQNAP